MMIKKICIALTSSLLCGFLSTANAIMITDIVGDKDGLGQGIVDGGTVPTVTFDNRSAGEIAATDGSQFTDQGTSIFGMTLDFVDFTHVFAAPVGSISSVSIEFGLGGMQSNDNNPLTKGSLEDGLFIDGILVADAFEPLNQGADGFDIFSVVIPVSLFSLFEDGQAVVRIDSNSCGGTCPTGGTSPIWYDYSEITITTASVPEPSIAALLGLGLLGIAATTRKRKLV